MNICQGLMEAAACSLAMLESRKEQVIRILRDRQQPDGGFPGKGYSSDLYYTGFAVLSLLALEADFARDKTVHFLEQYTFSDQADLAHCAAWIRLCRLLNADFFDESAKSNCIQRLERFRCDDGAWHHLGARQTGSAYGCFLMLGAYQDLSVALGDQFQSDALKCIESLKTASGGYYNEADIPAVSVPATAAAMVCRCVLGDSSVVDDNALLWLMRNYDHGGFQVMPIAPVTDLLSTAVAIHALSVCGADLDELRQKSQDYVNSLWDENIGFCANTIDRLSDPEYMFYGLLALGHLAKC